MKNFKNFVESPMGYLMYEMCQFLHVTPRQLGKLRHDDPAGMSFLERHFFHRKKEEAKHYKELERKSKAKKHGKRH